jgi:hypothetical protein
MSAVLLLTLLPAQAPAGLAARAEAAFNDGVALRASAEKATPHLREAAALYEDLHRRGTRSAALYRSLGNAYLLLDDVPRAVLAYRRGLRLAPDDADLRAGLTAARERAVPPSDSRLGRPPSDDRPPWLPRLRSRWLFLGAALFYTAACAAATRWLMTRNVRLLWAAGVAAALATVLAGALVWQKRLEADDAARPLVVIAEDGVLVRVGDGPSYPKRYEAALRPGVEARLLVERDGWLQIELSGGEVGWVPASACLVDRDE